MKKVFAAVISVLIMFAFAACAQQSSDGVYSITYTGRTENLLEAPDSARAGDAVEVKTVLLYDADTEVYVNGKKIEKTHTTIGARPSPCPPAT